MLYLVRLRLTKNMKFPGEVAIYRQFVPRQPLKPRSDRRLPTPKSVFRIFQPVWA